MRSLLRRAALSALLVLATIAVLEAAARVYYLARDLIAATSIYTGPPPPRTHAYTYWEDDGLYYPEPGYNERGVRINSAGLRGFEVAEAKPTGTYRILVIGDSTVFGLAGDDCPFPAQLERILRERTGRSIEVLNGGVEGYTSRMALHRMQKKDLLRFSPDLVILHVGWNDFYGSQLLGGSTEPGTGRLVTSSALLTWIREFQTQVVRPWLVERFGASSIVSEEDVARFYPERYVMNMRRFIELSREKGADVVITSHPTVLSEEMTDGERALARPYPVFTTDPRFMWLVYERYERARRDIAAQERTGFIDIAATFAALDKAQYFFDALHVYCPGNRVIAERIADDVAPLVAGRR